MLSYVQVGHMLVVCRLRLFGLGAGEGHPSLGLVPGGGGGVLWLVGM